MTGDKSLHNFVVRFCKPNECPDYVVEETGWWTGDEVTVCVDNYIEDDTRNTVEWMAIAIHEIVERFLEYELLLDHDVAHAIANRVESCFKWFVKGVVYAQEVGKEG